jgi:hypothetical protein
MSGPLDGPRLRQMLATLCVTSSLAPVALDDSNPTNGFRLGTLSVAGPSAIVGPILDTIAVSRNVEGASCEELGWHIFTMLTRAHHFASSVVTPWGYKTSGRSYAQPMSSHTISHRLPASFPIAEKKER